MTKDNDELAKVIAVQAGVPVEDVKKIIKSLEEYRLEHGEEAYREYTAACKEILETAKADGVPISVLLEALERRLSQT